MNDYIGLEAWDMGYDAHLTLMFFGKIDKDRANFVHSAINDLGRLDVRMQVKGFDCFGPNKTVPVVALGGDSTLEEYRRLLQSVGIEQRGFHEWNPHVTLKWEGPKNTAITVPPVIRLTGPYLKFDGKKIHPFKFF